VEVVVDTTAAAVEVVKATARVAVEVRGDIPPSQTGEQTREMDMSSSQLFEKTCPVHPMTQTTKSLTIS